MYGGVRVLGGKTSTKNVRETKQNIDVFSVFLYCAEETYVCVDCVR